MTVMKIKLGRGLGPYEPGAFVTCTDADLQRLGLKQGEDFDPIGTLPTSMSPKKTDLAEIETQAAEAPTETE